jgi:hypothetical protein
MMSDIRDEACGPSECASESERGWGPASRD